MSATCERFVRWLDAGMPAPDAGLLAHADACPRCAALLSLEQALLEPAVARASALLTDDVMKRIAAARVARLEAWLNPVGQGLPWWARAAAHPAAVLGLVAMATLAWAHAPLWQFAIAVSRRTLELLEQPAGYPGAGLANSLLASLPAGLGGATALFAIATPLLLLAGWALYAGSERLARHTA